MSSLVSRGCIRTLAGFWARSSAASQFSVTGLSEEDLDVKHRLAQSPFPFPFLFLFFLAAFAVPPTALAADGSSGCGPGWYILQENSIVSSALRATTNAILFPVVTLGMTFGTSNCTQHKLVLKEKQSLHFATMNYFELKSETAKGDGEYLSAFASTMGCPSAVQARLNRKLREGYATVFPKGQVDPEKTLLEVYKTILSDRELTTQCSLVGVG